MSAARRRPLQPDAGARRARAAQPGPASGDWFYSLMFCRAGDKPSFSEPTEAGAKAVAERHAAVVLGADLRPGMSSDALRPFADIGQCLFARDLPDDEPVFGADGINGSTPS